MTRALLPAAHGAPVLSARIRSVPEDFAVEEIDGFPASGAGEHVLLTVEKRGMNTAHAAQRIARWAGVPVAAIGYAGMKDRHAVTRQRFSVHLPGKDAPDAEALDLSPGVGTEGESLRVLGMARHARKLPRGALAGNRFALVLREVDGDRAAIEQRLQALAHRGAPNYFGTQRFGRRGDNVAQALAMFGGRRVRREERSVLLSAARSELFNRVLAARVDAGDWDGACEGDVWMLDGSHSVFGPEAIDDALRARIAAFDIHPTGPLWGRGELRTRGVAQAIEREALQGDDALRLRSGLEAAGLRQERRGLRVRAEGLAWEWIDGAALRLHFALPPGSYATTLLAELGDVTDSGGE